MLARDHLFKRHFRSTNSFLNNHTLFSGLFRQKEYMTIQFRNMTSTNLNNSFRTTFDDVLVKTRVWETKFWETKPVLERVFFPKILEFGKGRAVNT